MSFANPAFLFALGLLAVPIIIHLFNFRKYRRIKFTNVALLEEVKEKTQAASQLKNLLILLCRLLAIACLVIAFAEPFKGPQNQANKSAETVGLYIDNSPSMSAQGEDGKLFLSAVDKARTIIHAYPDNTSFILSTNSLETRLQRQLTKNEALDEVELVRESYTVKPLDEVVKKQLSLAQGQRILSFLVSDFQKSSTDFEKIKGDTTVNLSLVPVIAAKASNISIDSAWFNSPAHLVNASEQLSVSIRNYGSDDIESLTVELQINGKPAAIGNITLKAGSSEVITLSFVNRTVGNNDCEIRINDFPVVFDNRYFFSYRTNQKLSVFEVTGDKASPAIRNLFGGDDDYSFVSYTDKTIDYAALKGKGCLILNGLANISSGLQNIIIEKLTNGEAVAVFPPHVQADLSSYNNLLSSVGARLVSTLDTTNQKVNELEQRHPFFANLFEKVPQNIDLPAITSYYRSLPGVSSSQTLLRLQNGSDFLAATRFKNGNFYFFSSSLHNEAGNFAQHGLFVPVLLRIAETSGYTQQLSYTIGTEQPIRIPGIEVSRENLLKIISRDAKTELVPLVRKVNEALLVYPQQGQQIAPGNYRVMSGGNQELLSIGFNLSRKESDLAAYSTDELKKISRESNGRISLLDTSTNKLNTAIKENYEGKKLWKIFVLLTLVFITAEILLTKWLR